jgi:membrane protease YdiL (CAAX protease family)
MNRDFSGTSHATLRPGQVIPAVIVFVCAYLAASTMAARTARLLHFDAQQWMALAAVIVATFAAVVVCDRGSWRIGLGAGGSSWLFELGAGALIAALLIFSADNIVTLTASLHRWRGRGFPWSELSSLFLPAAVHEELLFRGYVYQKLRRWNRGLAVAATSLLFGLLHAGNDGATVLALLNVALAGVLFCLAYEWRQRLWLPISLHFFWNVISGPLLGYAVSGYGEERSLFVTRVTGRPWLAGGPFGIEGSVAVTAVELLALAIVWLRLRNSGRPPAVQIEAQKET